MPLLVIRRFRRSAEKIDEGENRARELTAEARAESDRIIQSAIKGKEKIREDIQAEFTQSITDKSIALVEQVMSKDVQKALNEVFLREVIEDVEQIDERHVHITVESGVLKSALPLDVKVRESLVDAFNKAAGVTVAFDEGQDESLIAGVVLEAGDFVIDGSLRGRLNQLTGASS